MARPSGWISLFRWVAATILVGALISGAVTCYAIARFFGIAERALDAADKPRDLRRAP